MTKRDGGPAFPTDTATATHWEGMTLRDYIAIHASEQDVVAYRRGDFLTRTAGRYAFADAMLREREG